MLNIKKCLEKISENVSLAGSDREQIIKIIEKYTGVTPPKKSIEIKNCTVYMKVGTATKNKIFINKKAILNEIASSSQNKIVDIV